MSTPEDAARIVGLLMIWLPTVRDCIAFLLGIVFVLVLGILVFNVFDYKP